MGNDTEKRNGGDRRAIRIIAPFVLLSLGLIVVNLLSSRTPAAEVNPAPPTLTPTARPSLTPFKTAVAATPTPFPTAPNAPTATMTASPTPLAPPTLPPGSVLELLGPPPGSIYSVNDRITFFWAWPSEPAGDQRFALYLIAGDQEILLGEVPAPNLGDVYSLSAVPGDYVEATNAVFWQVRLFSEHLAAPLTVSEARPLQLIPGS